MEHSGPDPLESTWAALRLGDALRERAADETVGRTPPTGAPDDPTSIDLASLPSLRVVEEGGLGAEFEILNVLGEGGMGVVVRAQQVALRREVAIKRMKRRSHDPAVRGLLAEARTSGALEHPNIVPVHALGRDTAGDPVLVMKRVEGAAWRDLIRDATHPRWERVRGDRQRFHLEVLLQVCHALELAHDCGVVHRDVKPSNVMLGEFGEVYLMDWGLACRAADRPSSPAPEPEPGLVGTPAYMAPEMLGDEQVITTRTDVYLLGAVLHEILTGRVMHHGKTVFAALASVVRGSTPTFDADVPPELAAICVRATGRTPEERFPSVRAFREAIAAHLAHRESDLLVDEALAELDVLLSGAERDPDAARTAFSSSAFGLRHALRIWPENARARRGLDAAHHAMATMELARGAVDAAEAHLSELPEPDEALLERCRAARRSLEAERSSLISFARERDLARDAPARARLLLAVTLLAGAAFATIVGAVELGWLERGYPTAFAHACIPAALLIALGRVVGFRPGNLASRRAFFALFAMMLFLPMSLLLGLTMGLHESHAGAFAVAGDALACVVMGVNGDLAFLPAAAAFGATAIGAAVLPAPADIFILSAGGILGSSLIGLRWLQLGRVEAGSEAKSDRHADADRRS